jgi:hypothetical protein
LTKTLHLLIDGNDVGWKFQILPHDVKIESTFEHGGTTHRIMAESISHFPSADDHVEIDGKRIALQKTK